MSRNGSGVYSLPAGNPVVTGTTISSSWANTTLSDIASALTGSVAADGQTPMTGNLQMGSNKVTGLAAGTLSTDAVNLGQITGGSVAGSFTTLSASSTVTFSGGTANGVLYLNGSKVATSGSALVFDGTNLGVGTSSPAEKLDVNGRIAIGGTKVLSKISGDSYIWNNTSALNFVDSTGNTVQMKLDSSGNLGLGVTPSAWASGYKVLQVLNSSIYASGDDLNFASNTYISSGGTPRYIDAYSFASKYEMYNGTHKWYNTNSTQGAGNAITFTQAMTLDASGNLLLGASSIPITNSGTPHFAVKGTGDLVVVQGSTASNGEIAIGQDYFFQNQNQSLRFGTNNAERMRIDSSGNLLVNTTTAREKITVNGSIAASGQFIPYSGSTTLGYIGNDSSISGGSGSNIGLRSEAAMLFATNGATERMRIDSSGNLCIGQTSTSVGNGGLALFNSTASVIYAGHANGTSSGASYFSFYYNNSNIGSITQNGTTAVAYNTTSDYRLKTDVTPITDALTTVQALNPVSFTWVDGRKDDGFIAHELQAVLPNCVTGEKDAVNEDGTPKYQQMDNSGVIPFLVKAIQELNAKVTALEAQLGAK